MSVILLSFGQVSSQTQNLIGRLLELGVLFLELVLLFFQPIEERVSF